MVTESDKVVLALDHYDHVITTTTGKDISGYLRGARGIPIGLLDVLSRLKHVANNIRGDNEDQLA